MRKFIAKILKHKIKVVLVLVVLGAGGYFGYSHWLARSTTTKYITAPVKRGELVTAISGTGQIMAVSQVELKTQSSGLITAVNVKAGDLVKKGKVLVALDQRDANISVLQARASLLSAQANYNKLLADNTVKNNDGASQSARLSLEKAKVDAANSVANAQAAVDTAYNNLKLAEGGENSQIVNDAYQSGAVYLRGLLIKLDDALNQADLVLGIDNSMANDEFESYLSILDSAKLANTRDSYFLAKTAKTAATAVISDLSINSDHEKIDTAFISAEAAVFKMMQLMDNLSSMLVATPAVGTLTQSDLESLKSSIGTARTTMNSQYSTLLTQKKTIVDAKNSYNNYLIVYEKAKRDLAAAQVEADQSVSTAQLDYEQSKEEIKTARAQLESAQAQLLSAQNSISDNLVVAPFDGVVASVTANKGDQASASAAAVTLITEQKIAQITLNEVDVAQVKNGQKTTLTFDAIDGLIINGEVVEIDALGTVSQGVVSYNVKIAFDVQDSRIKSGMSVSASIITNRKDQVLMISSAAIKTRGSINYVELLINGSPQRKNVEVGLNNDTMTEIVSGLNEGDVIITQTITAATATAGAGATKSSSGAGAQFGGAPAAAAGGSSQNMYRMLRQ